MNSVAANDVVSKCEVLVDFTEKPISGEESHLHVVHTLHYPDDPFVRDRTHGEQLDGHGRIQKPDRFLRVAQLLCGDATERPEDVERDVGFRNSPQGLLRGGTSATERRGPRRRATLSL